MFEEMEGDTSVIAEIVFPYLGVAIIAFGWLLRIDKGSMEPMPLWIVAACAALWPVVILVCVGYAVGSFAKRAG